MSEEIELPKGKWNFYVVIGLLMLAAFLVGWLFPKNAPLNCHIDNAKLDDLMKKLDDSGFRGLNGDMKIKDAYGMYKQFGGVGNALASGIISEICQ
jgi:hypothetical protein